MNSPFETIWVGIGERKAARSAGTVSSRSSFVSQIMSFSPPLQSGFSVSARLADCALAGWPAPARAALPAVSMGDEAVGRKSRDPIQGHAAPPTERQGRGGGIGALPP